ncbi:MAG: hypothetical protein WBK08_17635, partial [Nitrospira sp.]
MKNVFRLLHASRCHSRGPQWLGWLAVLLVTTRLAAGFLCASCFNEIEQPTTRSFHLHAGDDRTPCHHGKTTPSPLNE